PDTVAPLLAVNTPRRESSTDALDIDSLGPIAGRWQLLPRSTDDDRTPAAILAPLISSRAAGRSIWDALLWTTLILVLAEPLIANRRPRRTAADQSAGRAAA
ncbi:MAG: hypothetical protein JXO22_16935, partial [Phycisphaerae bacterium]|nr:hypothetical protein [Phycisphaerae bacterium]